MTDHRPALALVLSLLLTAAAALAATACEEVSRQEGVDPFFGAAGGAGSTLPDRDVLDDSDSGSVDDRLEREVRVATFNVERFFDTTCDSGSCDAGDFELQLSVDAFNNRASQIAAAIRDMDSDVILLQEVESDDCIEALRERLSDTFPVIEIAETGAPASMDVAIVSRGELIGTIGHRDVELPIPDGVDVEFTRQFARELFEVRLLIADREVIAFAAHFVSQRNDTPENDARRLAEATAARDILLATAEANPNALIVLGGDLNEVPGSPPIDLLVDTDGLERVAADADDDSTYFFNDEGRALDHVFHVATERGRYVPGSAQVVRDPTEDARGYGGSDHAALRATFAWE